MKNITNFNFKELNEKFSKVYCLVSGGIDSTYLYEMIKQEVDNSKLFPVNCYNPLENNKTLDKIEKEPNFIRIYPELDNSQIHQLMIDNFLNIPKAIECKKGNLLTKKGKKMRFGKGSFFSCCDYLKHRMFLNNQLFKEEGSVIVSGIKLHDGFQRNQWLQSLLDGKTRSKGTTILNSPTFYHKHKPGQLYCYPFRDYPTREFPNETLDELKKIYPNIHHTGCRICPILVVFEDRIRKSSIKNNDLKTLERIDESLKFYQKVKNNEGPV